MKIQTLNKQYNILQRIVESRNMSILIAKEEMSLADHFCMLVMLKKQEQIYNFIPFCTEQEKNQLFDDFMDFFSKEGCLYLVFRYHQLPELKTQLIKDHMTLRQRLTIARNLLRKIVFLNLPLYIQYEVLSNKNLLLSDYDQVEFNYHLERPEILLEMSRGQVLERLKSIFEMIFRIEIKGRSCMDLEVFINGLADKEELSNIQIYSEFEPIYQNILILDEENKIKPKSFGFDLWEWIKKMFPYVKAAFIIFIIVLLIGYLIDTIQTPVTQTGATINYQWIGDLEIKDE